MATAAGDPKGYYAVLGLTPDADPEAVKMAYRARAKAVHPDHNRNPGASDEFHRIAEAYTVLRDVVRRAEYDSTGEVGSDDDPLAPTTLFTCCCCDKVTAQPRYLIFYRIKSWVIWAKTSRLEGIFCRDCADTAAVQASTATWTMGWWSLPGLLMTPLALVQNLMGGAKPRPINARVLIHQARAFLARGDLDLAYAVAVQARRYARLPGHRRQVEDILKQGSGKGRTLKDRWQPWAGKAFMPQLMPLVALPATFAVFLTIAFKSWDDGPGVAAGIAVQPPIVGEIRHVAVDALKVRQAGIEGAPVLTLLDRFTAVTTLETETDPEWTKIRAPSGVTGYVPTRALYGGSGDLMRHQWCDEHRGAPPEAGEVLVRRASGEHRMMIHNEGRTDAMVKLKTATGNTVMAYYVPATYHLSVGGIPEGTYTIEFATGKTYSRGCGLFVDDMRASQLPFRLTLHRVSSSKQTGSGLIPEISLAPPPKDNRQPMPIKAERFAADD